MRPKPTREEVEALRKAVSELSVIENPATSLIIVKQHFFSLSDAYIAQEEELKEKDRLLRSYGEMVYESNKQGITELERIADLKAESQALKALAQSVVDYASKYEEYRIDTDFLPILSQAKELSNGGEP